MKERNAKTAQKKFKYGGALSRKTVIFSKYGSFIYAVVIVGLLLLLVLVLLLSEALVGLALFTERGGVIGIGISSGVTSDFTFI